MSSLMWFSLEIFLEVWLIPGQIRIWIMCFSRRFFFPREYIFRVAQKTVKKREKVT